MCEAVLLFTLSAGRRLAELELVLFLVQVCVPMLSIVVRMYVMVCSVIGVCMSVCRECVSTQVYGVWCVLSVCICIVFV